MTVRTSRQDRPPEDKVLPSGGRLVALGRTGTCPREDKNAHSCSRQTCNRTREREANLRFIIAVASK